MNGLVTDEMMAATVADAGLSMNGAQPGPDPLASPSYKALESRSLLIDGIFVKRLHPEMRDGFDLTSAMQAARQAGEVGAGPRVLWSDVETGAIAMEALGNDWCTATQFSLQDPGLLTAAIQAMKAFHATAPLPGRFDPFALIDAQIHGLKRIGATLPDDILWLRRLVAQIEPLMDGVALAPCRNDGSASNLMVGPEGQVKLLDFDRAGMHDPLHDLGCLLAEVTDFERDMQAGYIAYAGEFDIVGFSRARLWSHVDDMLHALWSRLKARTSQRHSLEWLKYGEWRLMRLRLSLMHPQFEERIRIAQEATP